MMDGFAFPPPAMRGRSVLDVQVDEAASAVVRAHEPVRRLVEDYHVACRAMAQYAATLNFLITKRCVPDDLAVHSLTRYPDPRTGRYAEPDERWTKALAALRCDPDAPLPD